MARVAAPAATRTPPLSYCLTTTFAQLIGLELPARSIARAQC